MSGSGFDQLERPPSRYDPTGVKGFPSKKSCIRRDTRAARAIVKRCDAFGTMITPAQRRELARLLDYASRSEQPPASRAAQGHYGSLQMRVGGAMCALIDRFQRAGDWVSFMTICARDSDVTPDNVMTVTPRLWVRQMHTALDRIIRDQRLSGPGWLILFLDCEYQEAEGVFRFHWHGFAFGSQLTAIQHLRKLRKYRSPKASGSCDRDPVRFRIRITKKPLTNLLHLCVYPLKSEWRCRPVASNQPGNRSHYWSQPLPEQFLALERLFYHRWSLQDIAVVRGLRVVDGRLSPTGK